MTKPRIIELLSPAKNADTAIAAITHGADAVYIGPSNFGARASAGNSLDDIARAVDFAHSYDARVYATVNTILFDNELRDAERLIRDLYRITVEALIVQDMGILRLDIPPIALHASTQCDTRTPEKARFLEEVGFSQGVKPATIAGQIAKGIQLKKIDSDKYQRFIDREDYSRIVRLFQDGKLQLGTENLEDPIKVVIALAIYRMHFPNLKQ